IAAGFPERVLELRPAVAYHAAGRRSTRFVLPYPKKQRHAEHEEPHGDEQVRRANVLPVLATETEPRILGLHERKERDRERDEPAAVAAPPTEPRHAADLALLGALGQERVGEHGAEPVGAARGDDNRDG